MVSKLTPQSTCSIPYEKVAAPNNKKVDAAAARGDDNTSYSEVSGDDSVGSRRRKLDPGLKPDGFQKFDLMKRKLTFELKPDFMFYELAPATTTRASTIQNRLCS